MNASNQHQRLLRDISDDVDAVAGELLDLRVTPPNRDTIVRMLKRLDHATQLLQRAQFRKNTPLGPVEDWEADL